MESPWLQEGEGSLPAIRGGLATPAAKVGLGVFLAVALCLFSLMRPPSSCGWTRLTGSPRRCRGIFWFNTAFLSSAACAADGA